jgi:hypothetical protein
VCLPGAAQDHIRGVQLARCDFALHFGARQAHPVCVFQGSKMLVSASVKHGCFAHTTSPHYVQ